MIHFHYGHYMFLDQLWILGRFNFPTSTRKIAPQDVRLAVDMGDKVGQCGCQLKLGGPSDGGWTMNFLGVLPSGKLTLNYGESSFLLGKPTRNHNFQWLC